MHAETLMHFHLIFRETDNMIIRDDMITFGHNDDNNTRSYDHHNMIWLMKTKKSTFFLKC